MHHFGEIDYQGNFSENFFGLDHSFASNYQAQLKNWKSVQPHLYLLIRPFSGHVYVIAHPVCAQNKQQYFQTDGNFDMPNASVIRAWDLKQK